MKIEGSARVTAITPFSEQNHRGTAKTAPGKAKTAESAAEQGQVPKEFFPGEEKLIHAIEKSNPDVKLYNTSLKFSIHETTKEIMVKIIDNETQEVIREIPSEKILNMIGEMLERTGLFVDKQA